jgi:hypothetical protein
MIERGGVDYYFMNVGDNVDKVSIILHSHVGDADLTVSREKKKPQEDPMKKCTVNLTQPHHHQEIETL